jgi:hypothetical protein
MRSNRLAAPGVVLLFLGACADEDMNPRDVTLGPPIAQEEDSVGGGARECDPRYYLMSLPGPSSCCRDDEGDWFMAPRKEFKGWLVHRNYGRPCTTERQTRDCIGLECYYGPCGASRPELHPPPAYVFHPISAPSVCGRQAADLEPFPEEWTAEAPLYDGITRGTCPWSDCVASGPAVRLTVNAFENGATGHVASIPAGIRLAGAGTSSELFGELDVMLFAWPDGRDARAVFAGDCVATGQTGAVFFCKLHLGPEKTVSVTYASGP